MIKVLELPYGFVDHTVMTDMTRVMKIRLFKSSIENSFVCLLKHAHIRVHSLHTCEKNATMIDIRIQTYMNKPNIHTSTNTSRNRIQQPKILSLSPHKSSEKRVCPANSDLVRTFVYVKTFVYVRTLCICQNVCIRLRSIL